MGRRCKVPVPPPPPLPEEPENMVILEVSGPKSLMRAPVTRKVNIYSKVKDVLRKFLARSKLKGYRATKLKGTLKDSVGLDARVKDFIEASFRKVPKLIRMRLMKRGRGAGQSSSPRAPEIITIDEGDEEDENVEAPMAMGMVLDGVLMSVEDVKAELEMPMEEGPEENDQEQSSAPVASDSQMKQVESANVSVVATPAPSQPSARVIPDEHQPRPSTSSALREEMARNRAREKVREERQKAAPVPPPPTSSVVSGIGNRSVQVKLEAVNLKQEIPDPASTIADLRAKGVKIDNLKSLTQKQITHFSNPFLLLVREEIRALQRSTGCPEWQKVVAKAPRCAYMITELFNDASLSQSDHNESIEMTSSNFL